MRFAFDLSSSIIKLIEVDGCTVCLCYSMAL
jgi:hypothetical protein